MWASVKINLYNMLSHAGQYWNLLRNLFRNAALYYRRSSYRFCKRKFQFLIIKGISSLSYFQGQRKILRAWGTTLQLHFCKKCFFGALQFVPRCSPWYITIIPLSKIKGSLLHALVPPSLPISYPKISNRRNGSVLYLFGWVFLCLFPFHGVCLDYYSCNIILLIIYSIKW